MANSIKQQEQLAEVTEVTLHEFAQKKNTLLGISKKNDQAQININKYNVVYNVQ